VRTKAVDEQLNRGRNFLRKYGLSRKYKLAYIDFRAGSSELFRPYYTITEIDEYGGGHRLLSGRDIDELMKAFIGNNKEFLTEWNKTKTAEIPHHNLDIAYREMKGAVNDCGVVKYKIKKTTDERRDVGIGRCYGFYKRILNGFVLVERSLNIEDYIKFIAEEDPDVAKAVDTAYKSRMKEYEIK